MNKFKLMLIMLFVCFSDTHSQSIDAINNALDNIFYRYLDFDYNTPLQLPDSTQKKVIAVLNGYIPLKEVKEAITFNDMAIKNIERKCKEICGTDSLCNVLAKDSIMKKESDSQLHNLQQYVFPSNFILAIGTWSVKGAEPILLRNINDERYPKRETKLALAKLGNDSIYKQIMDEYTEKYVVNNTSFKDNNPDLIYKTIQISDQINFFIEAGIYLKEKQILLNMIDLLDIQGKTYIFDDLVPVEESFLIWMGTRFMNKTLLENGKYDEWEKIIDNYFYLISQYKDSTEISKILSRENKEKVKKQLKDWISENVIFEEK